MSCPSDPSVFVAPATERGRSGPAAGLEGAFLHHAVATIQNRSCARLHQDPVATDTPSKTQRVRVFTTTWWHSKAQGTAPRPRGPGSRTLGRRRFGDRNPNGVEQNAVAHKTRPDSSAGWNGGRAWGDAFEWGHVGLVAPRWGACSTPHASPGFGPAPCGVGAEPWALGCHHVVVKSFEWLPRCGEERRTAGRASIANSLIRSFFDGWRHSVCDSSYRGSLRINAWAERRLHNAARRNQRWAIRRRLIWTVAGSR